MIASSSSKCRSLISSFFICVSTSRATKLLILRSSTDAKCCKDATHASVQLHQLSKYTSLLKDDLAMKTQMARAGAQKWTSIIRHYWRKNEMQNELWKRDITHADHLCHQQSMQTLKEQQKAKVQYWQMANAIFSWYWTCYLENTLSILVN